MEMMPFLVYCMKNVKIFLKGYLFQFKKFLNKFGSEFRKACCNIVFKHFCKYPTSDQRFSEKNPSMQLAILLKTTTN